MKLTGLHLLLTYQCTLECDHCFVWGSPWQHGTMTQDAVHEILNQAHATKTIKTIYFEGGEPFMYFATLLDGVWKAADLGFEVGIVSNAYWATSVQDAIQVLTPFQGLLCDLSISSDQYHWSEASECAENARLAAERLKIPIGFIRIAEPEAQHVTVAFGQLPEHESGVMYRGRAAEKLVGRAHLEPWHTFDQCVHEDLRSPARVHVDPFGNVHICDGIVIGNLFQTPLPELCKTYNPESNPITAPLLEGGPAELARAHGLRHQEQYADACHFCYTARVMLRERFPEILAPDQMYRVN
jgi:MoaA/NifB/PqqE/SkfB family radical SAM enzyme